MHRPGDRQRRRAERGVVGVAMRGVTRLPTMRMALPLRAGRAVRRRLLDPTVVAEVGRARADHVAGAIIEIDVHPERETRPQRNDVALARLLVEVGNLDAERLDDRLRAAARDADGIAARLVAAQQVPVTEQADLVEAV